MVIGTLVAVFAGVFLAAKYAKKPAGAATAKAPAVQGSVTVRPVGTVPARILGWQQFVNAGPGTAAASGGSVGGLGGGVSTSPSLKPTLKSAITL